MRELVDDWCCIAFEKVFGEYTGYGYYQALKRYVSRYKPELIALSIVFSIKLFLVNINYVPTGSMNPSILEGDIVLVNKLATWLRKADYGDVVTFDKNGTYYVKRVVGKPGDKIQVKNGLLYLNGKLTNLDIPPKRVDKSAFPAANELPFLSYVSQLPNNKRFTTVQLSISNDNEARQKRGDLYKKGQYLFDSPEFIVPEGQLFVMGDNRPLSNDSRYAEIGYVPVNEVEGFVVAVLFNINHLFINTLKAVQGESPDLSLRAGLSTHLEKINSFDENEI